MAKRKRKSRAQKIHSENQVLTTIDKRQLAASTLWVKLPKTIYLKPGTTADDIKDVFDKKIAPTFELLHKKLLAKKRGTLFILGIKSGMNFDGKRVKHGFSSKRSRIRNKKQLKAALNDIFSQTKNGFLAKMLSYLARKSIKSYSINAIKVEVIKPHVKRKNHGIRKKSANRSARKKSKAKSGSAKGPKRKTH